MCKWKNYNVKRFEFMLYIILKALSENLNIFRKITEETFEKVWKVYHLKRWHSLGLFSKCQILRG